MYLSIILCFLQHAGILKFIDSTLPQIYSTETWGVTHLLVDFSNRFIWGMILPKKILKNHYLLKVHAKNIVTEYFS